MSGDFLSRWSRRKAEAAAPSPQKETAPAPEPELDPSSEIAEEPAPPLDSLSAEPAEAVAEITAEEIAALPPIEQLSSTSDLGPFLRAGVPALLRNAALRRMWTVDPAIRDFLNDAREYAYDWNTPGGVPGLGPLLPTDDVKALARCVFDGRGRRAEAEEESAAGLEGPPAQEPSAAADAASESLAAEPPALQEVPVARADVAPGAAASDGEAAPADSRPPQAPDRAAETGPRRFRRHGGATPA